jgi:hypothetical protein
LERSDNGATSPERPLSHQLDQAAAMVELTKGQAITCEPKAKDRYGRTVALCVLTARILAPRW